MRLLIKPGAQFPVDGEVAKGATAADESNLTGESAPVEKDVGESVLAGTINLWGAVETIVTKPAAESALQRIIKLIREAQQQKAPSQQFTDKFSTWYTYFVLGLSLAMFFVWWLGFHLPAFSDVAGGHSAFYRTMTLLVVSSPCALVLSIPSAVLAAIAFGARHGILFRGGAAVEKLAEIPTGLLARTAVHPPIGARHHSPRQTTGHRTPRTDAVRIRYRPGPARQMERRRRFFGQTRLDFAVCTATSGLRCGHHGAGP
jgi:Zn2+/Cd2+-exporting ATPase